MPRLNNEAPTLGGLSIVSIQKVQGFICLSCDVVVKLNEIPTT